MLVSSNYKRSMTGRKSSTASPIFSVMILKTAPTVLYKSVNLIGNPEEYVKRKQTNSFPAYETKIPVRTEENDIEAAMESMKISLSDNEEEKTGGRTDWRKSDADLFMPVKVLNQFSSDWRIKVRVTKKYDVKRWNNARGNGELFNVDMVDQEGTQI